MEGAVPTIKNVHAYQKTQLFIFTLDIEPELTLARHQSRTKILCYIIYFLR